MATHLERKRRQAMAAFDRITRTRRYVAEADRALADYQAALAHALGMSVDDMEDVHAILLHICNDYQVTPGAIMSRVRTQELAEARHMAMAIAHTLTRHSLSKLGRFFQRDHGTILHAIEATGRRMDTDSKYRERFDGYIRQFSPPAPERVSA